MSRPACWTRQASRVRALLAVVLLALLAMACLVSPAARAQDASNDDMPYWALGHLVFDGASSCWYPADEQGVKESDIAAFKLVDGRAYPVAGGAVDRSADTTLFTRFYPNGELVFQLGAWERPDRLDSGCHCILQGNGPTWFRENAATMERFSRQVTKVTFDASLQQGSKRSLGTSIVGWLAGLGACTQVEGMGNLKNMTILRAARLFEGCTHLEALDLSELDLSKCTDMNSMFEGCASLEQLVLGSKWTQASVQAAADKAVFPVEMSFTIATRRTVYAPGSEIPAGFGEYLATSADISGARIALLKPGAVAITTGQLADVGWAGIDLPEGVAYEDVIVFSSIAELAADSVTSLEYTGASLEPSVVVEFAGQVLQPGVHYRVLFENNVEAGTAAVHVEGIGIYRGRATATFEVVDTSAYAFFYSDGTLALQAGHVPVAGLATRGSNVELSMRMFDAQSTSAEKERVAWDGMRGSIRRLAIDKSFSRFALRSMHGWFSGCTALGSVSGMGNINGSKLVDVAEMFKGCASLDALDLSGFASAHVETMADMLAGCTSMDRIVADDAWQNVRMQGAAAAFPAEMIRVGGGYVRYSAGTLLPSGAGEYRTGGFAMQLAKVAIDAPEFECTGAPIEPELEVTMGTTRLIEGKDYTVEYANNVLAGQATATVLGTGAFSGGLVVPFTIRDAVTAVGTRLVYRTAQADYIVEVLKVKEVDGRVVPAQLRILSVQVKSAETTKLVLPDTCTVGGVSIDVTAVGSKLGGTFRNVTCVVIGAKVRIIHARAFAKTPKVRKLQLKTKVLAKATNCLKGSKVKSVTAKCKLGKAKRKAYKKMFEKKAGRSNVKFVYGYKK